MYTNIIILLSNRYAYRLNVYIINIVINIGHTPVGEVLYQIENERSLQLAPEKELRFNHFKQMRLIMSLA